MEGIGVRRFAPLVDARADEERSRRERLGKYSRRRLEENWRSIPVNGRNRVNVCYAGCTADGFKSSGVGQLGGESERSAIIEIVNESLTEAVVHHAESAADRCLASSEDASEEAVAILGRPRKCEARTKVLLVPIVVSGLAVCCARPVKGDQRILIRRQPLGSLGPAIQVELIEIGCWGNLKLVGFPGWGKQRPAQAKRNGKGRFNFPGVLRVELKAIYRETALECAAVRQGAVVSLEVKLPVNFRHHSHQRGDREVVEIGEARVNLGVSAVYRIQGRTRLLGVTRQVGPRCVGAAVAKGG